MALELKAQIMMKYLYDQDISVFSALSDAELLNRTLRVFKTILEICISVYTMYIYSAFQGKQAVCFLMFRD